MNEKVLIIIPAYNESANIVDVVNNLKINCPEYDYLIINDCSTDETEQICKENNFNYISLPINLGIGGGVQTGYKYALANGYTIAVQHDGDGQHNPSYIKDAVKLISEGKSDIVIGSRYVQKEGFQSSFIRRFGITFLSNLIKMFCGTKVLDVTSGFRAINRKFIAYYAKYYSQDYPEPEAIISASLNNGVIKEIPVIMNERKNGKSSINFSKSLYYMIKVSIAIIIQRYTCKKEKNI